jgi:hypothetical protein
LFDLSRVIERTAMTEKNPLLIESATVGAL